MLSPAVFGVGKPASDVNHLIGALIVVVSAMAMGGSAPLSFELNSVFAGLLVAFLALPRGPIAESFGSWDK